MSTIASRWLVIPGQPLTGHQQSPQVVQSDRAGQASSCVAGAPLRSPPRLREDVTGPQRDPRNWQILVRVGRDKKLSADSGTLEQYRQEVKSMEKMS